jgi:hypothetical protein
VTDYLAVIEIEMLLISSRQVFVLPMYVTAEGFATRSAGDRRTPLPQQPFCVLGVNGLLLILAFNDDNINASHRPRLDEFEDDELTASD